MATLVSPVAFPDESQLRQASLITLIVVIAACAVLLIAIIGGLMCLFFCYRQKRIFITKQTKAMKKEVAESVRQTSQEVSAVQKYLRSSGKPPSGAGSVSLAALSSPHSAAGTPPAPRRQAATPDAQPEEIVLETIDEEDRADDRPLPPAYNYPMEEIDDSFKKRQTKRPSPPAYTYPAYALD